MFYNFNGKIFNLTLIWKNWLGKPSFLNFQVSMQRMISLYAVSAFTEFEISALSLKFLSVKSDLRLRNTGRVFLPVSSWDLRALLCLLGSHDMKLITRFIGTFNNSCSKLQPREHINSLPIMEAVDFRQNPLVPLGPSRSP